jgi:hypothetical protein
MNKKYFSELLNKYLSHEASEEECELLIKHYNVFQSEPDIFDFLTRIQKDDIRNEIENRIWDEILADEISLKEVSSSNYKRLISIISVAVLLLSVISFRDYFFQTEPAKQTNVISRLTDVKQTRLIKLPDGITVILMLGARLNYPSSFDGLTQRKVYLDG